MNSDGAWFLPIQRQVGQKLKEVADGERTTLLFSSEKGATRIFALTAKVTPEQIGRIGCITINVAPFFARSSVIHASPTELSLLDSDGKKQTSIFSAEAEPIVSASISDPFIAIRLADGTIHTFIGDSISRQISPITHDLSLCQSVEVFSDPSGIYRSFEAGVSGPSAEQRMTAIRSGQQSRMQLTQQQIQRLQAEKPAISADAQSMESAINAAKGTQWLAVLTIDGDLQIRSLPDMAVVLQSGGLMASEPSFTDDASGTGLEENGELDHVKQMLFAPVGKENPRPHLLVGRFTRVVKVY